MPDTQRVLVVDDNEQIRGLIRRALGQHGYRVDVAASVSQARLMSPGGYDALLIDARVGEERGADLIEELRAADPATPRRCLIVTGGGTAGLPADVAQLGKPFRPADLVSAVRALPRRGAAARSGARSQSPAGPAEAGERQAEAGAGGGRDPALLPGPAGLLQLVARLRAAERMAVADVVHDGPLQGLTAALLTLQLAAADTAGGVAGRLAGVAGQLGDVATVLRRLVERGADGPAPGGGPVPGGRLAEAVLGRAGWLVAGPVTVDVQPAAPAPGSSVAVLAEVVELLLFLLAGDDVPSAAEVSVQLTGRGAAIQAGLTGCAAGLCARTQRDLAQLAAALGGTVRTGSSADGRQAFVTLPFR